MNTGFYNSFLRGRAGGGSRRSPGPAAPSRPRLRWGDGSGHSASHGHSPAARHAGTCRRLPAFARRGHGDRGLRVPVAPAAGWRSGRGRPPLPSPHYTLPAPPALTLGAEGRRRRRQEAGARPEGGSGWRWAEGGWARLWGLAGPPEGGKGSLVREGAVLRGWCPLLKEGTPSWVGVPSWGGSLLRVSPHGRGLYPERGVPPEGMSPEQKRVERSVVSSSNAFSPPVLSCGLLGSEQPPQARTKQK